MLRTFSTPVENDARTWVTSDDQDFEEGKEAPPPTAWIQNLLVCTSCLTDDDTSWRSSAALAGCNPEAAGWRGSERRRDRWFSPWESVHTGVHTDAWMWQRLTREQHSFIHSFTWHHRDARAKNTHLAKSTHFSMIFLGDRRRQMIPTNSGWNETRGFRKWNDRRRLPLFYFKPRTLSSCRARWCVASIRIPRREQSVESKKLRRTVSSCGGDPRKTCYPSKTAFRSVFTLPWDISDSDALRGDLCVKRSCRLNTFKHQLYTNNTWKHH